MITFIIPAVLFVIVALLSLRLVFKKSLTKVTLKAGELRPEKFWPERHAIISVFLSQFLAILAGLFLFGLQDWFSDNTKRNRYEGLINTETSQILFTVIHEGRLQIPYQDTLLEVLVADLPCDAVQEAGLSGLFDDVQASQLLSLASSIREYRLHSQHLVSSLSVPIDTPAQLERLRVAAETAHRKMSYVTANVRMLSRVMPLEIDELTKKALEKKAQSSYLDSTKLP